jgi:hypothetical protein
MMLMIEHARIVESDRALGNMVLIPDSFASRPERLAPR